MINSNILNIKALEFNFIKKKKTLTFSNFEIQKGDLVLLSGRNGSGKSTLIHFLMRNYKGLAKERYFEDHPDSKVYFLEDKKSITDYTQLEVDDYRKKIIYMDQKDSFYHGKNIEYNLIKPTLSALTSNLSNKEIKTIKKLAIDRIKYYFDKYEDKLEFDASFNKFCHSYPENYSGGQQKFLKVFQYLIKLDVLKDQIALLLLDEPLNNLDREKKMVFNNLIQDARETHPELAIIFISHCRSIRDVTKELEFKDNYVKLIENQSYCELDYSILNSSQKRYEYIFGDE